MGAELQQATARHRAEPAPSRESPRPHLRVISGRNPVARAERRRFRRLVVTSALIIAGALLIVAAGNALVASRQVTLDAKTNQLGAALRDAQNLQLARADLEAPNRILSIAEARLHMVRPPTVTYLVPVNPGPDGSSTHGRGAKTPGRKAEGSATGH